MCTLWNQHMHTSNRTCTTIIITIIAFNNNSRSSEKAKSTAKISMSNFRAAAATAAKWRAERERCVTKSLIKLRCRFLSAHRLSPFFWALPACLPVPLLLLSRSFARHVIAAQWCKYSFQCRRAQFLWQVEIFHFPPAALLSLSLEHFSCFAPASCLFWQLRTLSLSVRACCCCAQFWIPVYVALALTLSLYRLWVIAQIFEHIVSNCDLIAFT